MSEFYDYTIGNCDGKYIEAVNQFASNFKLTIQDNGDDNYFSLLVTIVKILVMS